MSEILKGNFKPKNEVEVKPTEDTLEHRFEREAMKRLGGSIAFVSKHKVMWDSEQPAPAEDQPADPVTERAVGETPTK